MCWLMVVFPFLMISVWVLPTSYVVITVAGDSVECTECTGTEQSGAAAHTHSDERRHRAGRQSRTVPHPAGRQTYSLGAVVPRGSAHPSVSWLSSESLSTFKHVSFDTFRATGTYMSRHILSRCALGSLYSCSV